MYYGRKVILRGLELSDVDYIMKHWNKLELRKTLGSMFPNSNEEEQEWIRRTWKNRSEGNAYQLAITDLDGRLIGTIGLFNLSNIHRSAELGISILDPENRGKGYGTDAVKTICAFGFRILNLHRIYLYHYDFNTGKKAYSNAGFQICGKMRDGHFNLGKYVDVIYMDILENEYFEKFSEYTLFRME